MKTISDAMIVYEPILKGIVHDIRQQLADRYDIRDDYVNYSGLCEEAYDLFKEAIEMWNNTHDKKMEVLHFHGEQRHTARIDPRNWPIQHTWTGVKIDGETIYVDPTSQQFQWLYKDIPQYYISSITPPWYYWDRKNPAFSKLGKLLNKINWKRVVKWPDDKYHRVTEHLIDFIQYELWGGLCRWYRKRKLIDQEMSPPTVHSLKNKILDAVDSIVINHGIASMERLIENKNQIIGEEIDKMVEEVERRWTDLFIDEMKEQKGIKKLIDLPAANCIIDLKKPIGLFYLIEGDFYMGIDSRGEDVVVTEHPTIELLRSWLLERMT